MPSCKTYRGKKRRGMGRGEGGAEGECRRGRGCTGTLVMVVG